MTKAVFRPLSPVLSALVLFVSFVSPLNGSPLQQDEGAPLYEAVVNEQPDLVRSLLEQGADPDSRGPDGMPVLVQAVSRVRFCYRDAECIDESMSIPRLLLEYGADANVASDDGFTAVMIAWRSPEALDLLIENGADVNAQDAEGRTVLMRAAASRSYTPGTPSVAMYRDRVNALLEHGADPTIRDAIGRTALEYAGRRGRSEAVSLLPWTDEAALREAVAACPAAVPPMVRFCADRPPASVDSLSDILEQGVNLDAPDFYGWTVLMHAADAGHAVVVEALLEHGADAKAQDAEGKTALFYAVDEGHDEVAEILRNRLP